MTEMTDLSTFDLTAAALAAMPVVANADHAPLEGGEDPPADGPQQKSAKKKKKQRKDGARAEFHLVRSNPIARALVDGPLPARLAVQGPHSYVSPDWYGIADQVPTWNYIAVHLTGEAFLQPQEALHDLLDRQSALFEDRLVPKPPWTTAKMTPGVLDRMMRQIVPCAMRITAIDGTWKLGQNKTEDARLSAADHIDGHGIGQEVRLLCALMRGAATE